MSTPATSLHPCIRAALSSSCAESGDALYITNAAIVAEAKKKFRRAMLR